MREPPKVRLQNRRKLLSRQILRPRRDVFPLELRPARAARAAQTAARADGDLHVRRCDPNLPIAPSGDLVFDRNEIRGLVHSGTENLGIPVGSDLPESKAASRLTKCLTSARFRRKLRVGLLERGKSPPTFV